LKFKVGKTDTHRNNLKWRFQTEANKFDPPKQEEEEEEEEEVWRIALPSSPGRVHVVLEDDEASSNVVAVVVVVVVVVFVVVVVVVDFVDHDDHDGSSIQ
jgi:hypothetical protein